MRSLRPPRRVIAAVIATAAVVAVAGCGGSSFGGSADSNFGGGARTVERIAVDDRKAPVTVTGTTLDGAALSTASWRGKTVVLNYWGSWCGPCVKETPDLKAAWAHLRDKGVEFLGLDSQESAATAKGFVAANGLTYPSLQWAGGDFLVQLKGLVRAPPTTVVLDPQGRVAARVLAPVNTATLVGLVQDVQSGAAG